MISLIINDLLLNPNFTGENKLIVTGTDPNNPPFQIYKGNIVLLHQLKTFHEEADVIIIHQLIHALEQSSQPISIVCDDTDVFLLLLHFCKIKKMKNDSYLEETSREKRIICIKESIKIEEDGILVEDLLPLHALTGCDTVSQLSGIGKVKPLNILKKDKEQHLHFLCGTENIDFEDIYKKCVNFVSRCYNMIPFNTMNEL